MPNFGCAVFVAKSLQVGAARNDALRAVEVGAHGIYGGYRAIARLHGGIREYIGIDIVPGPGVDVVCDARDLVKRFGRESFDVVIATELIEHVQDWRAVISEVKRICKPGGLIIITTRSKGYVYHAAPLDFWRLEVEDMGRIFSDCEVLLLEKDQEEPGVFVTARRPVDFTENDLSGLALYSIIEGCRVERIDYSSLKGPRFLFILLKAKFWQLGRWVFTCAEKDYTGIIRRQAKEIKGLMRLFVRKER